MHTRTFVIAMTAAAVATAMSSNAQQPPPGGRGGRGGRAADFPQRAAADPAIVERGKSIYTINCQFCHGADTRGGDTGPSLLRSQLVQDDQNGEKIGDVVRMPTPRLPMCVPPFVFQK